MSYDYCSYNEGSGRKRIDNCRLDTTLHISIITFENTSLNCLMYAFDTTVCATTTILQGSVRKNIDNFKIDTKLQICFIRFENNSGCLMYAFDKTVSYNYCNYNEWLHIRY